jgi:proline racemase
MLWTVESHTGGTNTRIVVGGIGDVLGKTMMEKKIFAEKNLEWLTRALVWEPRGFSAVIAAILTPATTDKADIGVLFLDAYGVETMSGHGAIGVVTALIETGRVKATEPITKVVLDTPVGLVEGRASVSGGEVDSVTLRNVPSFLYKSSTIDVPGIGKVKADMAFGGDTYAIVGTDDLGIDVEPQNSLKLIDLGMEIKQAAIQQIGFVHPDNPLITNKVWGVRINQVPPPSKYHSKETVIGQERMITRSPCGTAVCADMAASYVRGDLKPGEETVHESILGSSFKGRIVGETKVGPYKAIVPEITGTAYLTGYNTIVIDPRDRLGAGFLLPASCQPSGPWNQP